MPAPTVDPRFGYQGFLDMLADLGAGDKATYETAAQSGRSDVEALLETWSTSHSDPDVRAMCAATLENLQDPMKR